MDNFILARLYDEHKFINSELRVHIYVLSVVRLKRDHTNMLLLVVDTKIHGQTVLSRKKYK